MLHVFLKKGPWFEAKTHGYGAGMPIAWQGWLLLSVHVAAMVGVGIALQHRPVMMVAVISLVALVPMPLYAARTLGGWRWRWGIPPQNKGQKRPKY